MTVLIDPPAWPAHGRLWSHLISDTSFAELHAFAAAAGVPRRGFERDHYDVPAERYRDLVVAGAVPASSREVVERLHAAGLRRRKSQTLARRAPGKLLLRPRPIRRGDVVGVPAVAGVVPPELLEAGVARLESWGLRVRVGSALEQQPRLRYLAGSDEHRATDFAAAWMDPDVCVVMPSRGGFGTQRILDLLDWRRLAEAAPKTLVGFSDVTAMHQAVATLLGVMTVHGHTVASLARADEQSVESCRRLLMEPESVTDLLEGSGARVSVAGRAEGVLTGGNLALLAAEIGTAFSRPARGGIVVLEDTAEWPFRIDRLLTQLLRTGWFEGVRGIVLGAFTNCGAPAETEAVLAERLRPLGVPMIAGADVGHTPSTRSVPFGIRATLDTHGPSLTLHW